MKLAITEYNTMFYPNTVRKGLPDEHTLGAAVANAANLNEMLRASDTVHIGSYSDLVNGWLGAASAWAITMPINIAAKCRDGAAVPLRYTERRPTKY